MPRYTRRIAAGIAMLAVMLASSLGIVFTLPLMVGVFLASLVLAWILAEVLRHRLGKKT